jgi:transposase-like protein
MTTFTNTCPTCAQTRRQAALKLYVDGTNFRRIARHLGVPHQSVIHWVDKAAARLPAPPTPLQRSRRQYVETLELDEIYTTLAASRR